MRIFNPCKKCIVRPICKEMCNELYEHKVFKARLHWFREVIKSIKWAIKDRTKESLWPKIILIAGCMEIIGLLWLLIR